MERRAAAEDTRAAAANLTGQVRCVRNGGAPSRDARSALACARLAVRGRPQAGRGAERPDALRDGAVWKGPPQPARSPPATGDSVEIRRQGDQVDRDDLVRGADAA